MLTSANDRQLWRECRNGVLQCCNAIMQLGWAYFAQIFLEL